MEKNCQIIMLRIEILNIIPPKLGRNPLNQMKLSYLRLIKPIS